METKRITCVVCPRGCEITVQVDGGRVLDISGSGCPRGDEYAAAECINPVRTLTTTMRVEGGRRPLAPVKSAEPLPRQLLAQCVREINRHTLKAPVKIGEVVVRNILGTGVDIVSTGNC